MPNTPVKTFPEGFLWGAATSAHQVEGNNVNSDLWVLEHVKPTLFKEPSGDACDHYHRYAEDIGLLAGLGLNTYRFSIEWARIEPERGQFSKAALEHYRRMLLACRENHVLPVVTLYHFTSPRWFVARGGWENKSAGDDFVRYCEQATKHLGDLIGLAATFNEPNLPMFLRWAKRDDLPFTTIYGMTENAARAVGSDRFGSFFLGNAEKVQTAMISAHCRATVAAKSGPAVTRLASPWRCRMSSRSDPRTSATRSGRKCAARGWRRHRTATSWECRRIRAAA